MAEPGAPTAPRPVILAVDDDAAALALVGEVLERRYGQDYRVVRVRSPQLALGHLERMAEAGDRLAIVLADQWMPETTGAELLQRAQGLHPHAKRALLVLWAERAEAPTTEAIRRAVSLGHADTYVLKPRQSPDEAFHRTIAALLQEWSGQDASVPREITIVAGTRSPRGHALRSLLDRNAVGHVFLDSDSPEGSRLLEKAGRIGAEEPVVYLLDGSVLVDPSPAELARAWGAATEVGEAREVDVAIVGAGPAGLAAAVYAASEGLTALVVEREAIGGQAGSSSRIRNYLGFARGVGGAELARRAYEQAWLFGADFLLMREATGLRAAEDRLVLDVAEGGEVRARCVVLAMGVAYRRLGVPALEALAGAGVYYGASPSEGPLITGEQVYVVGAGNSAGQAAAHLRRYAKQVTLVVRGPSLEASMSSYLIAELAAAPNVALRRETEVVDGGGAGKLEHLTLRNRAGGTTESVPAGALFVLIGARPYTAWLPPEVARDGHGFVLTGADIGAGGWALERPPFAFETTLPGVFAVGDVRSRSVKRVASAVGEGSVVIGQVHQFLARGERARVAAKP